MALKPLELWDGTNTFCMGFRDGLPYWRWGWAPQGLRTRTQLRAARRRLGRGQEPFGLIVWKRGRRTALLYREDLTQPSRTQTPALLASVAAMERARRTCIECKTTYPYRMPKTRICGPCAEAAEIDATVAELCLQDA
ncbi:RRQRL motif-containing zinc-binding protein [Actinophytocola sp.]|uniref:RRQRL motif-containing zinc-binding protein n=1 Tax=Actinophytocola sp. TaxID=1872138 RepID=UPI002ED173D7